MDVGGLKQVDGYYVRHIMSSSDNLLMEKFDGVARDFCKLKQRNS